MAVVLEDLEDVLVTLTTLAEALEPDALSPEDARMVLATAAALERAVAGLQLLLTRRALVGVPYEEEGHRSAASWLAEATRTSVPEAVQAITTAERLAELPATTDAVRRGVLSPLEARTVAAAAMADPSAEADLLDAAQCLSVRGFRDYARRLAQAAHESDPDHRAELVRHRYFRGWTDTDGMFRFSGGVPQDQGLQVMSAVRSRAAHMADDANRSRRLDETQAALDADALVSLVTGEERRATWSGPEVAQRRRTDMIWHVQLEALRRGALEDGEICEIPGVGAVSLAAARHVLGEANLRLVVSDGVSVSTVLHMGRTIPAHVETALEGRDRTCVVPDCGVAVNLEIDHWQVPYAQGGPSELWNLCRLCRHHHRLKTFEGYELSGGPGKWEWRPPE
jgi:hypothetical protein